MSDSLNRPESPVETYKGYAALAAGCLGLIIILVGLKYVIDILNIVLSILNNPSIFQETIIQLRQTVGGSLLDIDFGGDILPISQVFAVMVFCGGVVVLAWLTISLMHTGAKIVSWTTGDREAVKQILQYAFGEKMKVAKSGSLRNKAGDSSEAGN